jgi:NAD(P)-dependent dehydrogenase (short-subunit alcohol dehydrogenase family)
MAMKVAVVTGCNTGLGYGIVMRLISEHKDYHVVMACRSVEKAQVAKEQLIKELFAEKRSEDKGMKNKNKNKGNEDKDEEEDEDEEDSEEGKASKRISLLSLDLADPRSIFRASKELHQRYLHKHFALFFFSFHFHFLSFFSSLILPNLLVGKKTNKKQNKTTTTTNSSSLLSCPCSFLLLIVNKTRFTKIEALYANAGIFPVIGRNFASAVYDFVFEGLAYFFTTGGRFMVQPVGRITKDGYGEVFISNVFGHFILVSLFFFSFSISL